ncbi:sensor histidine kinase [Amycolatopsis sp.]|uniref:sensor histidine kinase n=1 Tax=Amycolatopsis sp. TaxID=37632 RepID=UPI002E068201|nr:sensor histidine kinase [Amycolatopsis sp.]
MTTGWRNAMAGALVFAALAESVVRSVVVGASLQSGLALGLLALATTVPLVLLHPVPAAVAVTVASVLSLALFDGLSVAGLVGQLFVLYRLGRTGAQVLPTALAVPFLVLALIRPSVLVVLLASLGPAVAWAGIARRAQGEAQVHHAARQAVAGRLVEHTARGERARIARELHDVVAHHISMISVQAETARLTTPGMPVAGAHRLSEIGDTARAGLIEMRRLLGVLREDARTEVAERQPQPGLGQLNELIDEARETSGAGTRLIVSGAPVTLDPGIELAAYRIIQEALTNARRHAPGVAVDVELRYTREALRLRIRDNGPGPSPSTGGHGLTGMRERAAAVGGTLRAGPAAVGGFMVEATLPGTTGETT